MRVMERATSRVIIRMNINIHEKGYQDYQGYRLHADEHFIQIFREITLIALIALEIIFEISLEINNPSNSPDRPASPIIRVPHPCMGSKRVSTSYTSRGGLKLADPGRQ